MFRFGLGVLLLAAAAVGVVAVNADPNGGEKNRQLGEVRQLGNGKIWTWVQTDSDGVAETVGVTMTESALQGLPTEGGNACCGGHEYSLPLPPVAVETPFHHVVINWNPKGHEPKGIYDKPHFDFHFYMISETERLNIKENPDNTSEAGCAPSAEYLPKDYIQAPGIVGKMGSHWVDSLAPEFNGQPFTSTLIYGSYNGRVSFVEPMITKALLESHPNLSMLIKQPAKAADGRFVPGQYRISYDETAHTITVAVDRVKEVK
jgi:hypothetical protein